MKGLDFLKGFNELAEDIVLEAEKPEQYRKQKPSKGNLVKFAGVAAGVALLVGIVAAKQMGIISPKTEFDEETEYYQKEYVEKEWKTLNLSAYTDLEVVTDRAEFTPVTQDQSYNFETDMNPYQQTEAYYANYMTETKDTIYIAKKNGVLFEFQKETASAKLACNKPDCKHDQTKLEEDCEANLRVIDAKVGGIQYYKGDLYYSMTGGNSAILYRMSLGSKVKYKCVSLVGEKGYGGVNWLIHRGYIYFTVGDEGIYKMSVDNPADKELIVRQPDDSFSIDIKAYGSYLYFYISSKNETAMARYNMESEQIEQFIDLKEDILEFTVKNDKIYFDKYVDLDTGIYSYNLLTGEIETFLEEHKDKREICYHLLYADSDYFYIYESNVERFIDEEPFENLSPEKIYGVYTPEGTLAGKLYYPDNSDSRELEPLKIFHNESYYLIGSDSDRVYYIGEAYDTQVQEDGVIEEVMEGTEKIVILYSNKSEMSAQNEAPLHVAGEIYGIER